MGEEVKHEHFVKNELMVEVIEFPLKSTKLTFVLPHSLFVFVPTKG